MTAEDAEERADAARLVARVAGAASGTRKALSEARYATSLQQMRIRDADIAKVTQARTYALAWQPRSACCTDRVGRRERPARALGRRRGGRREVLLVAQSGS